MLIIARRWTIHVYNRVDALTLNGEFQTYNRMKLAAAILINKKYVKVQT